MSYIRQITGEVEEGKLTGFACSKCGLKGVTFAVACPSCGSGEFAPFTFSGYGTVRTFTILAVPSEQFVNDAPYAYVVVDLEEGCGVSGWMPDIHSQDDIMVGDRVHFTKSYRRGVVFEKEMKRGESNSPSARPTD